MSVQFFDSFGLFSNFLVSLSFEITTVITFNDNFLAVLKEGIVANSITTNWFDY